MATKKPSAESKTERGSIIAVSDVLTTIEVELAGVPPGLLFQSKGVMIADEIKKPTKPRPVEQEAELRCHWIGTGKNKKPGVPWVMIYKSICKAAGQFKFRGATKMSSIVAATVACNTDVISLNGYEYKVYEEFVRIPPRTGAMVRIGRPLFPEWAIAFELVVDAALYNPEQLKDVFAAAGAMVGIGAWRPELKGPHGRFRVTKFNVL